MTSKARGVKKYRNENEVPGNLCTRKELFYRYNIGKKEFEKFQMKAVVVLKRGEIYFYERPSKEKSPPKIYKTYQNWESVPGKLSCKTQLIQRFGVPRKHVSELKPVARMMNNNKRERAFHPDGILLYKIPEPWFTQYLIAEVAYRSYLLGTDNYYESTGFKYIPGYLHIESNARVELQRLLKAQN